MSDGLVFKDGLLIDWPGKQCACGEYGAPLEPCESCLAEMAGGERNDGLPTLKDLGLGETE